MVLDKQFLFIIGAPRSGSTWLQAMLGAHPSVCTSAASELQLFNSYTAAWANQWKAQVRGAKSSGVPIGLPTLWTESEFYGFLREFLERVYERVLANKPNATFVLDKHGMAGGYSDHINRLLPNAKFIHIIRDGRDVVASLLAASQGWGWSWAPRDVYSAALMWENNVRKSQDARKYGDRYFELRYEELRNDGVRVLKSVFDFIGLPINLEDVSAIYDEHQFEKMKQGQAMSHKFPMPEGFFRKGEISDWRNALTPLQRCIFHKTVGDLLCELGYADGSWWSEHRYERFTLPLLSLIQIRESTTTRIRSSVKAILGPKWTARIRATQANLRGHWL